jgi:colanic acid/amylovoran biosynthesis glycosyltransferase
LSTEAPVIAYLFTTFPKATETFLQREIIAMRAHGVNLRVYSLWGGGGSFRGMPVASFNKWRLLTLFWMIPCESWRRPEVLKQVLHGLFTRRAPSWMNFWENMLGAGFACLFAGEFRKNRPALVHAAWGGAPATAAWLLWRLDGHRFSAAAHAYDIYEHGGDWWLNDKLEHAAFIHTSTEMGRKALIERGLAADKIFCIRRGLDRLPTFKRLRSTRSPLHLVCVARLVEKKGLDHQLRIYAALKTAGVAFQARIVGEGPLLPELERLAGRLGVAADVTFTGTFAAARSVEPTRVGGRAAAHGRDCAERRSRRIAERDSGGDVGGCARGDLAGGGDHGGDHAGGDRICRSSGRDRRLGGALRRLSTDDAFAEKLRAAARGWVEENFNAHRNAERVLAQFTRVIGP